VSAGPARTLVVGLGNPILSDDGIGWRVAQRVREQLSECVSDSPSVGSSVRVVEASVGGLSLAELLVGYRRAVVIDAIMSREHAPGTVYCLKLTDLPGTLNTASAHDTNLITALHALRRFGAEVPADEAVDVVAVEAQDVTTFAEECTPVVAASIPVAASAVMQLLCAYGDLPGDPG
jgi:hydrogenase maturation protease